MNPEFVDFLAARFSEAKGFYSEIEAFKKELRGKIDTLSNLTPDSHGPVEVKRFKWREPDGLRDVLVHDVIFDREEFVVAVDTVINIILSRSSADNCC